VTAHALSLSRDLLYNGTPKQDKLFYIVPKLQLHGRKLSEIDRV